MAPRPIPPPESLPGTIGRRRIYLMRHADVDYRDEQGEMGYDNQVKLTEEGRNQASAVAEMLKDIAFDRVICSGVPRTLETANLVLNGRNINLETNSEFEEFDPGNILEDEIEDLTEFLEQNIVRAFENGDHPEAKFGNGMRLTDFYAKATKALEQLLAEPGWTTLLLVAHGGTNGMLLSWMLEGRISHSAVFDQDPACVNILDVDIVEGVIKRKLIRALNISPYNLPKSGLFLTIIEALIYPLLEKRRKKTAQS